MLGSIPPPEIDKHFKSSDIVIVPSIHSMGVEEVTSLTILEGMACGKSVAVSNVDGLKETIIDGVTGRIVSEGNPDLLAEVCISILTGSENVHTMGANTSEHVQQYHSNFVHARRFIQVFDESVG